MTSMPMRIPNHMSVSPEYSARAKTAEVPLSKIIEPRLANYNFVMGPGLTGLLNLGSTCYINACVQILAHMPELYVAMSNGYKIRENSFNSCRETAVATEWLKLYARQWKPASTSATAPSVHSPNTFIRVIHHVAKETHHELETTYAEHDVPEFLQFIIDCLHKSISREVEFTIKGTPGSPLDNIAVECYKLIQNLYTKEYSEVWSLLYGVHIMEFHDLHTGEFVTRNYEPYFTIQLPLPLPASSNTHRMMASNITGTQLNTQPPQNRTVSLLDCFDMFSSGEVLEKYVDSETRLDMDVVQTTIFWSLPTIMVIQLKRFSSIFKKTKTHVDFPVTGLDLSSYVIGYSKEKCVYDLIGVCNHSGELRGGHYFSYVKHAGNGRWYCFNDSDVREIDESKIVTYRAYILFYKRSASASM